MSDFYKAIKRDGASSSTLDALDGLQAALPRYANEPRLGMGYGRENKYVSWQFDPREYSSIELLHITDVQFGHTECRVHRVIEYRDWVLAAPNRFMLWGGDMIDAATILSPGSPWDNICGPDSQVFKFCELMAPARHRVLSYIGGNHERRSLKTFGDAGMLIAYLMKVPYSSGQQLVDVHYGKHDPFKIHMWHGTGGARTKGAKAQMIERFMHTGDAQLYLVGHLHDCILLPSIRIIRRPGKRTVHMEKIFGGMSSSFLSFWGTYAEVAGLSPNDILMIRAVLEPDGRWMASVR